MIRLDIFEDIKDQKTMVELSSTLYVSEQEKYESYKRKITDKYGYGAFPPQMADPYMQEAENNYRLKFLEINMLDGDYVGMFYKVYNIYGNKGSYLWFKPISLNGNIGNEHKILNHLVKHELINILLIPDVLSNIDYTKLNQRNDEFYCYVETRYNEVKTSKYRSAKGINKLRKDPYNITFHSDDYDPSELHELSYHWWKLHKKKDLKFEKYLQNLLDMNKTKVLTWRMDGKLIGFTIISTHYPEVPIARIQHNRNILKTDAIQTDKFIESNLANLMHYDTIEYLYNNNYKLAYIGDAHGAGKFLAPYKARNFKEYIGNYDLPIERYLELYPDIDKLP